ncbi:hypothetical protein J4E86_007188 [Alternaria arbusti]|uniref:uncharacterized protein n=1 Tax=Alternaria arbusti TaxID=232088 RepID=UPI002220F2D4|nr:uncharacterized protein J4E86_007188 [Alternaria arbusti]KAI4951772.1 hypothetical protein J4E86_007188 [Alternaria arbusti]
MTAPPQREEQETQLRDKCYNLLRTETKLAKWLIEEDARYENRKAELQAQKDNIINEVNRCAQVTCRQLCAKLFKACPRKIRDYIYAYLLPDCPVVIQHCEHRHRVCEFFAPGSDILYNFVQPHSHLFKAAYVTPDFSIELLERFYSSTTFDVQDQFTKLGAFRSMDRGDFSIIPANYIVNLSMHIRCEKYDFEGVMPTLDRFDKDYPLKPRRTLLADLEALFGFKSGPKIDLHLRFNRNWLRIMRGAEFWECDFVVPVILPTMQRLAAAGTKVKLCFDYFGCEVVVDHRDVTMEEIKERFVEMNWQLAKAAGH